MAVLRLLFTRRWLTALAAAVAFAVAAYFLGVWQWGRHEAKVERNALLDHHYTAPPVPVGSVLRGTAPLTAAQDWTRVTATGTYGSGQQLLVRNRVKGSASGYEVLAALTLPDGRTLTVDRGWVAPSNRGAAGAPDVPPAPEGTVTVVGWLNPGEGVDDRSMPPGQLPRIDLQRAGRDFGTPVMGAYLIRQSEHLASGATPVAPLPLDPPDRDLGPNQAYAYQWWLFMVAGLGLVYLGVRRDWLEEDPTRRAKPKKVRIWDEEDE